ncbi:hypothetical protein SKAU_G00386050 [Synaphobranchus kaupii]|uniref:Uncharacterized protein n=1 Tax=Synaphobranchus kaupii TaxID=118154 RepID=A0A9Q1EEL4_SYNKA|nr:hypothetical protein SKAU_G00386050 [Synaphobranchus kaupii]
MPPGQTPVPPWPLRATNERPVPPWQTVLWDRPQTASVFLAPSRGPTAVEGTLLLRQKTFGNWVGSFSPFSPGFIVLGCSAKVSERGRALWKCQVSHFVWRFRLRSAQPARFVLQPHWDYGADRRPGEEKIPAAATFISLSGDASRGIERGRFDRPSVQRAGQRSRATPESSEELETDKKITGLTLRGRTGTASESAVRGGHGGMCASQFYWFSSSSSPAQIDPSTSVACDD